MGTEEGSRAIESYGTSDILGRWKGSLDALHNSGHDRRYVMAHAEKDR